MKSVSAMFACFLLTLCACGVQQKKSEENTTLSGLDRTKFNTELEGKKIALYTLKNAAGMEVDITNYGGRVVSVWTPDRNGNFADVVLGHDSIADYIGIDGNFGALIGRYGNRIGQGRFTLDGTVYELPKNNYGHCLHGGPKGFHHQVWDAVQPDDQTLELTYLSRDGEAGFPGNLNVKVTYSLSDDNGLKIDYEAITDKPTIVNLTNHSYFNLTGNPSQSIADHWLMINADYYTPIDSTFMTTGEIAPVENTPMDLRNPIRIGDSIDNDFIQLKNGKGYDHNWVLNTGGNPETIACRVTDPESGRTLEVYTTEPGIQFYAGNFLDGTVRGKRGIAYPYRSALCLESQHYPDSPNKVEWPAVVLRPGETYRSTCIYKFGTEK